MSRRAINWEQKRQLAREACHAAMEARFELGLDLEAPMCAYAACKQLGIIVRFVDVNMEGIYTPQGGPRIFLSVHRPLTRRHFNCAHELGHHLFGHGATLDDLREDAEAFDDPHPNEYLADVFAGHFLMPVLGVRRAFSRRAVVINQAEPEQILAVATEFGVGYETLLTQLAFVLHDVTASQHSELMKARPNFRRMILGKCVGGEASLVDAQFRAQYLDVEVNHLIVAPQGAVAADDTILPIATSPIGSVFRATRRGITELSIPASPRILTVRVAPERFVGLAKYRHLENHE